MVLLVILSSLNGYQIKYGSDSSILKQQLACLQKLEIREGLQSSNAKIVMFNFNSD